MTGFKFLRRSKLSTLLAVLFLSACQQTTFSSLLDVWWYSRLPVQSQTWPYFAVYIKFIDDGTDTVGTITLWDSNNVQDFSTNIFGVRAGDSVRMNFSIIENFETFHRVNAELVMVVEGETMEGTLIVKELGIRAPVSLQADASPPDLTP